MKSKVQLFPVFVDHLLHLEKTYETYPALEAEDKRALDFIYHIKDEFDFKNIVNFALPRNLGSIPEMFAGMDIGEILTTFTPNAKLPFDQIAIEMELRTDDGVVEEGNYLEDLVILAKNQVVDGENFIDIIVNYGLVIRSGNGKKKGKAFKSSDAVIRMSTDPSKSEDDWVKIILVDYEDQLTDEARDQLMQICKQGAYTLIFMMAALSCQNVGIHQDFPPSIVENNKRVKKKQTPYRQMHYIVVKPNAQKGEKNANKGSYKPKSTHIRRGHIRRYADKGISIWIESTVVNGGAGEAKAKEYVLR